MAKKKGVAGWHSMRKEQLVRALVKLAGANKSKAASRKKITTTKKSGTNGSAKRLQASKNGSSNGNGTHKDKSAHVIRRIRQANARRSELKDLTSTNGARNGKAKQNGKPTKDRAILIVRDAYWLQACWEISRRSVERAQAALGEHWHTARPTLRLMQVEGPGNNSAETVERDIEIHGGVDNWYIDLSDPPNSYRVAIGYMASNGRFYTLVRSNLVTTPSPGSSDAIDRNWTDVADDYEKIYAQSGGHDENGNGELQEIFEERLRRPMGAPMVTRYGIGAEATLNRKRDFEFEVDAEMIIYGATMPDAHVSLGGEPVKLRSDGTFTVRLSMPDRRQVLPVVASSADGVEQRTIVLAVERNTKVMEPLVRDPNATP